MPNLFPGAHLGQSVDPEDVVPHVGDAVLLLETTLISEERDALERMAIAVFVATREEVCDGVVERVVEDRARQLRLDLVERHLVLDALCVRGKSRADRDFEVVHAGEKQIDALLEVEHLRLDLFDFVHLEHRVFVQRVDVVHRVVQQLVELVAIPRRVVVELDHQIEELDLRVIVEEQIHSHFALADQIEPLLATR